MMSCLRPLAAAPRRGAALLALLLLCAGFFTASADSAAARYRFEGNKWLTLDLAVGEVHAEQIKFEWPATLMRVKTGYKATVKISNGSSRQISVGIAVVLYDQETKMVGAGTTGTKLGTISPGESAQFSIDFDHVTQRLDQAAQFGIALEVR
jgi:hypothetical protein